MHESGIVKKIVDAAIRTAGGRRITRIGLAVGELASIESWHLREHLVDSVDWKVEVHESPARVSCACGFSGRPRIVAREHDFVLFNCPVCGKTPAVESGAEITIERLSVES